MTKSITTFEQEQTKCWYTPQQFVPSSTFPYFENPSQPNAISVQQRQYAQQACYYPIDNYIPDSSPRLEDLIKNVPAHKNIVQQYSTATGNQYYVKAAMSYRQIPPMQKKQKTKRNRTAFTTDQILVLEEIYARQLYVSKVERESLTARLGLTDRAIKVWFQNRRMKGKRDLQESFESSSDSSPSIILEDIENQMQQCEVVDDYVSVPTELCDKLGELINQYVPKELVDSGLDSSSLESYASTSVSITQDEASPSTSLELSNTSVSMDEDRNLSVNKEESTKEDTQFVVKNDESVRHDYNKVTYEPISPAEGFPIELPIWKPQDPEEMKLLFEKHFC